MAAQPGVELHADPASLAPFLAEAWLALAPMASGSGVPLKVLEAWAAGVPVVAHPHAAAGLQGADDAAVAVVSRPDEWVSEVIRLLQDRQAAEGSRGC